MQKVKNFNRRSVSRGPLAIAELLVSANKK